MTTVTIDRALVEQALETIEGLTRDRLFTAEWARVHGATIAALRAALAEPVEPVPKPGVWMHPWPPVKAQQAEPVEPETCTWHQDGDSDSGVYATSCGHYFVLEDGTPEDNEMSHCCYCGKKLAQELITEDDDE